MPIESIRPGDRVGACTPPGEEIAYLEVLQTFQRSGQPVLSLELAAEDGETEHLRVTLDHPFWMKARGWVTALQLIGGDEILSPARGWLTVIGSETEVELAQVHNLEVESWHSYLVGSVGACVHNVSNRWCDMDVPRLREIAQQKGIEGWESLHAKDELVAMLRANRKPSKREMYIGKGPRKPILAAVKPTPQNPDGWVIVSAESRAGIAALEDARKAGRIRNRDGVIEVLEDTEWFPYKDFDMAHIHPKNVVEIWNKVLKYADPRSQLIKEWMEQPGIYKLQHKSINRSEGAKLGQLHQYADPKPKFLEFKK